MSNETKNDQTIAAAYTNMDVAAEKVEKLAADLRRTLREQSTVTAAAAEDRRREQDKALYDMAAERQRQLDGYLREDRERDLAYKARETALSEGEDELLSVLNVTRDAEGKVPTARVIRTAFTAHLAKVETAAEGKGKGIAKGEYETAKKIDDANAAGTLALLKQENTQLRERNTSLERQVADLMLQQGKVVGDMKDLAARGLDASAGIQGKANDALSTAASAGTGKTGLR